MACRCSICGREVDCGDKMCALCECQLDMLKGVQLQFGTVETANNKE